MEKLSAVLLYFSDTVFGIGMFFEILHHRDFKLVGFVHGVAGAVGNVADGGAVLDIFGKFVADET